MLFFYILINHNYTNHVTGKMVKKNNNKFFTLFLIFLNKYITTQNIVFIKFNALNFVHNFNFNNTIIFNTYNFHHCFFHEQNMIFCHRILLYPFGLTAQNNPVVIDLRYLYGSTLESNHNN